MVEGKGGSDAAFFLFLFAVAVLGFGGSLQHPLTVLRVAGFGAAISYLWGRTEAVWVSPYPLLVGGFVLLSIGHAFSSIYFWVSFQHALNIALAAVLFAWAVLLFRRDPRRTWNIGFLMVTALAIAEVAIALYQRVHEGDLRPRGTFDNSNYLSEFLAAASILCFARYLWKGDTRRLRFEEAAVGILFLAASMSLASSRGVLFASIPAIGVLLAMRFGLRRGGMLLAGIGIPALGLLGFRAAERFFWPDPHNYSRWIIWKSALRTFLDHPFGVGLGGFKYYWFATQSPVSGAFRQYGKFAATAHNEYLEVLSGLGAIGFILFLAVLAYPLVLVVRNRMTIPPDGEERAAGAAAVLVLSGFHATVNSNFHVFGIFFLDAVMLGALFSGMRNESPPAVTLPPWIRRAGMIGCAGLLVASLSTGIGALAFDRGGKLLREGDLTGAERSFRLAHAVDRFRSAYPDALSALHYKRYREDREAATVSRRIPDPFFESLQWEDRARSLNPRELQYVLRLSSMFLEIFRLRGEPSDAELAIRFAENALRINPYAVEALWARADILEALGSREDAVKDLEKAVSVEPNFCRGYARLADFSRGTDPEAASRWSAKQEACRKHASTLHLEENETWLVELPEKR